MEHKITMKEHQPIRAPPRRLPYTLREELESELGKLLDSGCVESSSSPYSSGLGLVRKKDGDQRGCVDYCIGELIRILCQTAFQSHTLTT